MRKNLLLLVICLALVSFFNIGVSALSVEFVPITQTADNIEFSINLTGVSTTDNVEGISFIGNFKGARVISAQVSQVFSIPTCNGSFFTDNTLCGDFSFVPEAKEGMELLRGFLYSKDIDLSSIEFSVDPSTFFAIDGKKVDYYPKDLSDEFNISAFFANPQVIVLISFITIVVLGLLLRKTLPGKKLFKSLLLFSAIVSVGFVIGYPKVDILPETGLAVSRICFFNNTSNNGTLKGSSVLCDRCVTTPRIYCYADASGKPYNDMKIFCSSREEGGYSNCYFSEPIPQKTLPIPQQTVQDAKKCKMGSLVVPATFNNVMADYCSFFSGNTAPYMFKTYFFNSFNNKVEVILTCWAFNPGTSPYVSDCSFLGGAPSGLLPSQNPVSNDNPTPSDVKTCNMASGSESPLGNNSFLCTYNSSRNLYSFIVNGKVGSINVNATGYVNCTSVTGTKSDASASGCVISGALLIANPNNVYQCRVNGQNTSCSFSRSYNSATGYPIFNASNSKLSCSTLILSGSSSIADGCSIYTNPETVASCRVSILGTTIDASCKYSQLTIGGAIYTLDLSYNNNLYKNVRVVCTAFSNGYASNCTLMDDLSKLIPANLPDDNDTKPDTDPDTEPDPDTNPDDDNVTPDTDPDSDPDPQPDPDDDNEEPIDQNLVTCGMLDKNDDKLLDFFDYLPFVKVYRKSCSDTPVLTGCGPKDTNKDGKIDFFDFIYFSRHYHTVMNSCVVY